MELIEILETIRKDSEGKKVPQTKIAESINRRQPQISEMLKLKPALLRSFALMFDYLSQDYEIIIRRKDVDPFEKLEDQ